MSENSYTGPEKNPIISMLVGFFIYTIFSVYLLMPVVNIYDLYKGYIGNGPRPDINGALQMYSSPMDAYSMLSSPLKLKEWAVVYVISIVFLATIIYIAKNSMGLDQVGIKYKKDDGTQGTANWMTMNEAKEVLNVGTGEGIIFGMANRKIITMPDDSFFNKNVAVFGASGSMKSRSVVRPNIMQLAEAGKSMIITDPKGELSQDMIQFLIDKGYVVKTFNLVNMQYSDRWNPIAEVTDDISAQTFSEVVIANTQLASSKAGGDPFWDRAEQNLLKALVLYVKYEYPENERTLASVYSLLACSDPQIIDKKFAKLDVKHPAKMPYNIYCQASDNVRTGVVIGLGTRLQVFQNSLVQELTNVSDIDLTLPGKEKCAYFCITSDMESTFDFLGGLFYSFLFIKLIKYADLNGGKGEKEIGFILDEFPNIGAIPDFPKKISTMRSRGIFSMVIFQNIAQLKNRYPNDTWAEIIGNCDSRLFLGATDTVTAQFVSDLMGDSTVETVNTTRKNGFEGLFDMGSTKIGTTKRRLKNPDELLRLPHKNAILLLRGQKPLMLEKMDYTKHKLAKQLKPKKITEYKKEWAENILYSQNIKLANQQDISQDSSDDKDEMDKVIIKDCTLNYIPSEKIREIKEQNQINIKSQMANKNDAVKESINNTQNQKKEDETTTKQKKTNWW